MALAEQATKIDDIVTKLLTKEEERGGKGIFYTTKYQVLSGTLQGITDTKYDTEEKLTEVVRGLDTKKNTTLNAVRSTHKNSLSKLAYPSNSTLESTLRDTTLSLSTKTKAIIEEYQSMYAQMLLEANDLSERSSRPLNLESWSMVKLSNVGAFASLDDAQQAILALGKLIDTYPAQFTALNAVQKEMSDIYVKTIRDIE